MHFSFPSGPGLATVINLAFPHHLVSQLLYSPHSMLTIDLALPCSDVDRAEMTRNESRLLKEARRKASRSSLIQELAEEVRGAPRELRHETPGFNDR